MNGEIKKAPEPESEPSVLLNQQETDFLNYLRKETSEDFVDVAYRFYSLLAPAYPDLKNPFELDYKEAAQRLDPRKGGTLEHHQGEKITDSALIKAVFDTAAELGFLSQEVLEPRNEMEEWLGIVSEPIKVDNPVEAVVVPGGASDTIIKRLYHALNAIHSGAVKTDKLILLTGHRPLRPDKSENNILRDKGYTNEGTTEFDLAKNAAKDFINVDFEQSTTETRPIVFNGHTYQVEIITLKKKIAGQEKEIVLINAPFDQNRRRPDGTPVDRAITEETFKALQEYLGGFDSSKELYLVSHDIWQLGQNLFARETLEKNIGRKITGSGPRLIDRVQKNEAGELTLRKPDDVLAEMNKYFNISRRFWETVKLSEYEAQLTDNLRGTNKD